MIHIFLLSIIRASHCFFFVLIFFTQFELWCFYKLCSYKKECIKNVTQNKYFFMVHFFPLFYQHWISEEKINWRSKHLYRSKNCRLYLFDCRKIDYFLKMNEGGQSQRVHILFLWLHFIVWKGARGKECLKIKKSELRTRWMVHL